MEIRHDPRESTDPYDLLPTERSPFLPATGEAVRVCFTIDGARELRRASVLVYADGAVTQEMPARRVIPGKSDDGERPRALDGCDYWEAVIGPFATEGERSYVIGVEDADGRRVESPAYPFDVGAWRSMAGVLKEERAGTNLTITGRPSDGSLAPVIAFEPRDGVLGFELGFVACDARAGATDSSDGSNPSHDPGETAAAADALDASDQDDASGGNAEAPGGELGGVRARFDGSRLVVTWARDPREEVVILAGQDPAKGPTLEWMTDSAGRVRYVRWNAHTPADERFYGFGERFDAFDQRGRLRLHYVHNQYLDQRDRTYLPVPFYLSSKGYGVLVETDLPMLFDMASTRSDRSAWTIRWPTPRTSDCGGCAPSAAPSTVSSAARLRTHVLVGPEPRTILTRLQGITGPAMLPPVWSFGPWISSNAWDRQSEVEKQLDALKVHDIPASVIVIEAWSDEATFYIFNDATYALKEDGEAYDYGDFEFPPDGRWPDPKGMVERIHEAGLRLILWQIPVIKDMGDEPANAQRDIDERIAIERGYVVKDRGGQPFRIPKDWFARSLVPDYTNPEARAWWFAKRRYLLHDLGVDGFKTDGGEFIWGTDITVHDGTDPTALRNRYPNLYVAAYWDFLRQERGEDAVCFSRAGALGAQRWPMHWAGDQASTWSEFQSCIRAGLNAGLSGIPFWGWDIGGFSGEIPSAELFLRSVAAAAFAPVMQFHAESKGVESKDRTPWNIAERTGRPDVLEICRAFSRIRMEFLPYIEREAAHAAENGEPLMRAMLVDFPDDEAVWSLWDQWMFGRDVLVAPVLERGATNRQVYLPAGAWRDYWNGTVHHGPKTITRAAPLDEIPLFVRVGSDVVPVGR